MTLDTNTTTRPYAFHSNCDHDETKKARRQCRNRTRRALTNEPVSELRTIARSVDLQGRSRTPKQGLVYFLSFAPAVREAYSQN